MIGSKIMDQWSTHLAADWGQPSFSYNSACTSHPNQLVVPGWMNVIFNSSHIIILRILHHNASYYVKEQRKCIFSHDII